MESQIFAKAHKSQSANQGYLFKGLRHENFAVLSQFFAEILSAFTNTRYRYQMNPIRESRLPIIFYLVIFDQDLKKLVTDYSSFNSFPSLPSVATDDRKQFQCRKMEFHNKTRPLFLEFN